MAYDTKQLFEQAKEVIQRNPIFFIEDLLGFLPCSKPTFYEHFKIESDELNALKELIDQNKLKTKTGIRAKLYKSEKAAELLALYRLICTPDERRMLNQNYLELTGKDGGAIKVDPFEKMRANNEIDEQTKTGL